jgi:hypothetical protein
MPLARSAWPVVELMLKNQLVKKSTIGAGEDSV